MILKKTKLNANKIKKLTYHNNTVNINTTKLVTQLIFKAIVLKSPKNTQK
ncbi:hypothetical protein K8941_01955 [Buchnera aphidicola (Sitobion miscanthi)]|nr:hypothetical protein [Buchnera aphidicola (Sitobion miscanthi)]